MNQVFISPTSTVQTHGFLFPTLDGCSTDEGQPESHVGIRTAAHSWEHTHWRVFVTVHSQEKKKHSTETKTEFDKRIKSLNSVCYSGQVVKQNLIQISSFSPQRELKILVF